MNKFKIFWKQLDQSKSRDTGLAAVLILLVIGRIFNLPVCNTAAIVVLALDMILPVLFKPLAFFWFSLASGIGFIMSKILLSVIFFILIVPVGSIRRLSGKDPMQFSMWKKGSHSLFKTRNYTYKEDDIINPF